MSQAQPQGTKPTELAQRLEDLERRVRLMAATWRGDAARRELHGAPATDDQVCALHNCAMDLDLVLTRRA